MSHRNFKLFYLRRKKQIDIKTKSLYVIQNGIFTITITDMYQAIIMLLYVICNIIFLTYNHFYIM